MNKKSNFRSAAFLAAAMMISLGAMAGSQSEIVVTQSASVKFDRANAATIAGAVELYSSLNQAASRVCVDTSGLLVAQGGSFSACRHIVLSSAVDRVGIEAVSALHQSLDRNRGARGTVTVN